MKKVSAEEIEKLYRFTRQHYVEYYDVQTELVDHLANAIEEEWKENPEQDFGDVLQKEFRKFGVYGFSDVVEKKQLAIEKKYWKLIWKEAKNILRVPKMSILVLLLFGLVYFLLGSEEGMYILIVLGLVWTVSLMFYIGKKSSALKKKKSKGGKVYLLETLIHNMGGSFSLLWLPFHILYYSGVPGNIYLNLLICSFIVVLVLTSYICLYELPKKKNEILKKAHPELKFIE